MTTQTDYYNGYVITIYGSKTIHGKIVTPRTPGHFLMSQNCTIIYFKPYRAWQWPFVYAWLKIKPVLKAAKNALLLMLHLKKIEHI